MNTNTAIAAYWATENTATLYSFTDEIRLSEKVKSLCLTNYAPCQEDVWG
jgi:hypothetical protein